MTRQCLHFYIGYGSCFAPFTAKVNPILICIIGD